MWRYILKRLVMIIPVLLGVTFFVYMVLSLAPGDPVQTILGDKASAEAQEQLRAELGLDKPIIVQYLNYMSKAIRGDFGISYKNQVPVMNQVRPGLFPIVSMSADKAEKGRSI